MRGDIPDAGWLHRDMGWLIAAARIGKTEENNGSLPRAGSRCFRLSKSFLYSFFPDAGRIENGKLKIENEGVFQIAI